MIGLTDSLVCCRQWINHIEFEFLPVYRPSAREKEDANLFASNVRTLLATSMGVPMSDHGVDDTILLLDARARYVSPPLSNSPILSVCLKLTHSALDDATGHINQAH